MVARRSCLSVPGSSEKMLGKARGLPADELVLDLEDAVAPPVKDEARERVAAALRDGAFGDRVVAVRVNAVDTRWGWRDVATLAERSNGPLSLVLPKVEHPADVTWVERLLDALGEGARGIRLQALIESAAGLAWCREIATASPRLEALILGYADLSASLGRPSGVEDPPESWVHAQESVLVAARTGGLQAIDGPYLGFRDEDGLRRRAEHARRLGYDGKWAIHPVQVTVIEGVFTPTSEEFRTAQAVIAALEQAEAAGRGAAELDGAMVDEASRRQAVGIVARGEAAGVATAQRAGVGP
ncbi:MAG TPA: CoA ester lyase [Dermatophilaceae bacterium]|nr:CoA ester lyase [Dermatophilaceae bacterium]